MKNLGENRIKLTLLDPLIKFLSSRTDVCDLNLDVDPPSSAAINEWEQVNNCLLSNDVKLFYTMCNGFQLKWSYKLIDSSVPVSDCRINSIENLKKLTISSKYNNCFDPSEIYLSCNGNKKSLKFTDQKLFFELDACEGYSKVCLVFNKPNYKINNHSEPQSSVWLVDRSLDLHYLTNSFTSYIALMMSHCAIKQWQYAFTEIGLSPQTRQWLLLVCPGRLRIDENAQHTDSNKKPTQPLVKFNAEKIFNTKKDSKKLETSTSFINKKKPNAPNSSPRRLRK